MPDTIPIRRRMLCADYWRSGEKVLNFGETFIDLLGEAFGVKIVDSHPKAKDCWLLLGSEFHKERVDKLLKSFERVIVWGQGNGRGAPMAIDTWEPYKGRVVVRGVRGPLTIEQNKLPPSTPCGDPGFALPNYFSFERDDRADEDREILYVPHWHNMGLAPVFEIAEKVGATYMAPAVERGKAATFKMTRLYNAKMVLTNALHVWIFCQAYAIPHALFLHHDERFNMPMKWKDVWLSLGQKGMVVPVSSYEEAQRYWDDVGQYIPNPYMGSMILAAPGMDDVGLFEEGDRIGHAC